MSMYSIFPAVENSCITSHSAALHFCITFAGLHTIFMSTCTFLIWHVFYYKHGFHVFPFFLYTAFRTVLILSESSLPESIDTLGRMLCPEDLMVHQSSREPRILGRIVPFFFSVIDFGVGENPENLL